MSQNTTLRLRIGRDALHAEALHRGMVTWSAEATYASLVELSDAIARLAAEPPWPCRRLVIAIEHPPLQVRTLDGLPPVKPRALAALVAHQAARCFRTNGQALATDAVWVGNGTRRVARAAAVEESLLDAILAGARAAGLVVAVIAPANETAPLRLLPSAERAARERAKRVFMRRLGGVAVAAWVAVGVVFLLRLHWERRAAEHELAAIGAPVSALLAARRELREAEATVSAVRHDEGNRGRSLAALGALAAALPDSAIVISLTWTSDGSGVLSGSARRAREVIARLERANVVAGVRLEGPVVPEAEGGREWERFTIVFGAPGLGSWGSGGALR